MKSRLREWKNFLGPEVVKLFILASMAGVFLFVVESSFVLVLQGFLSAVGLVGTSQITLPAWYPKEIGPALSFLVVFGVLRGVAMILKNYLAGSTFQAFVRVQRERIFSYGLHSAQETSMHHIISLFTERVNQVGAAFFGISQILVYITSTALLLLTGLVIAPYELILGLVLLGGLVLPLKFLNKQIDSSSKGLLKEWDKSNSSLILGLKNYFLLRVYNLISEEEMRGKQSLKTYSKHYTDYYYTSSIKNTLPSVFGVFIIAIISLVSIKYIGRPPAVLFSFFYIFIRIAQGASEISAAYNDYRLQKPGIEILKKFYSQYLFAQDKKNEISKSTAKLSSEEITQWQKSISTDGIAVQIKGLNFSYRDKPIFENFNLELKKGNVLVIQGESGSGKSTLLSLILGVLEPKKGTACVNGVAINRLQTHVSPFIGYVGPEPFLVEGSVRENLLYGNSNKVTEADIWWALEIAQLKQTVDSIPDRLDHKLNEHTQLSTGQKQRLAIARALLRKPKLLVLDEATANLDQNTEAAFIKALTPVLNEITTIIISHKDAFNEISTGLIKLEKKY